MSFHYSPKIITDGLVLYLDAANTRSYPRTGTTWTDLSRGGNNGSLINGPIFNSANGGNIVFDGVDDFINCTSANLTSLTTEATITIWLKCNSNSPTAFQTGIFGFTNGLFRSHYVWTDGKAYFDTFRVARVDSITLSAIDRTTPHMLTITTKAGDLWKLYQNSTLVASTTSESSVSINSLTQNLGSKNGAVDQYWFNGSFFNIAIYNRALSATEIRQNYNATKTRFGL